MEGYCSLADIFLTSPTLEELNEIPLFNMPNNLMRLHRLKLLSPETLIGPIPSMHITECP